MTLKVWTSFFAILLAGFFSLLLASDQVEKRVKTVYDSNGRPVNQAMDAKGWHQVAGSVTLASGKATVALNTSTANGRQDVSFRSNKTYRGSAWSLDTSNTYTYRVYPLTGSSFLIRSSDTGDTATVYYRVEGE